MEQLRLGDPGQVGLSSARLRIVEQRLREWVGNGQTRGLVVLAARRGVIVLHEALGTLNPEPDSPPVQLDTVFYLASIGKVMTATAIMCLVEDGLLGLNRPVQEYIPDFVGGGKEKVMLHHLLTHTSGLNEEEIDAYRERIRATVAVPPPAANQGRAVAERLFFACGAPLGKPPGTEMSYCDAGFVLLGDIVRRVTGQPLADFLRQRVFGPLEMEDTSLGVPEARRGRLVRRPATSPFVLFEAPDRLDGTSDSTGPGGVYATARDLATFGQMFLQRGSYGVVRVLSPASVAAMTHNQIPGIPLRFDDEFFPEASWGLGWHVRGAKRPRRAASLLSDQTFEHNGSGGVWLWVDPVHEIVGVYLSLMLSGAPGIYGTWNTDLFANAVTAAIEA